MGLVQQSLHKALPMVYSDVKLVTIYCSKCSFRPVARGRGFYKTPFDANIFIFMQDLIILTNK
jgi:hypothetical protein